MSTPINQIRRNADQQPTMPISDGMNSDSQLVEDILREMGNSPGIEQQTDINSQSYQYATDQSQVPAYKYTEPPPPEPAYDVNNRVYQQDHYKDNSFLGQMGITLSGDSIKDKVSKNIKYPGLVFLICFILSLPEFNRFLFGFVPQLLLESGQISIGGVLLKAVLGMVLFAIIAFFI